MKASLITSVAALTLLVAASVDSQATSNGAEPEFKDMYSCVWYPLCDQDAQRPVSQPIDIKTDSKTTKDSKTA